jgi:hypothetical protein
LRIQSVVAIVLIAGAPVLCSAQSADDPPASAAPGSSRENRAAAIAKFVGGAAIALGAHEGGHLVANVIFDADPGLAAVDFHGIPFFAITHRSDLSPGREFTISSAGFWVQHAGSEWLLTRRPRLRRERAPVAKGLLAFNVLASMAYAGGAFARTGPFERDTRGMAASAGIDERWIGGVILGPALLDGWRYFDPDVRWPVWVSRALKLGGVLLVLKAVN